MNWSSQQERALVEIKAWLSDRNQQVFRLFGYAGTGKTTLTKEIASMVKGGVVFGAFTGKAASVMRRKGCEGATTIHSLIYAIDTSTPFAKERAKIGQPEFILNHDSEVKYSELVIIDECSMVDETIGNDLLSFGKKVLVIGDPAQLPPVRGQGFFTAQEPDVLLTEVHRQAAENPIIALSMRIRNGERIEPGRIADTHIISKKELDKDMMREISLGADQIIVGLNNTRERYNRRLRALMGYPDRVPVKGDKVICLKNDRKLGVFNGTLWNICATDSSDTPNAIDLEVESIDEEEPKKCVTVLNNYWCGTEAQLDWREKRGTQEFAFGYAITCHKSQGSQWDNVVVFDESGSFREDGQRWRYTAITRAAEKLTLVIP